MIERLVAITMLAMAMPAHAADVTYGTLPSGPLSTNEVTDVSAELCRDHLFNPKLARARLPKGYRLIPAAQLATDDPGVAALIKNSKTLRDYGVGSLCFVSAGSFVVDGKRVNAGAAALADAPGIG